MITAATRRSLRELTRRRARAALTIVTIALAVAGIWLYAIPGNIRSALEQRAATDAMHTLRLAPNAAPLGDTELTQLRALGNVAALDVRTLGRTEMRIDGRTQEVVLVGVEDFARQFVNIVSVGAGALPDDDGAVVTDSENARTGRYRGAVGDRVEVARRTGGWETLLVAGRGGTLRYSSEVPEEAPVLYLSNRDVQRIMGYPAPNSVDIVAEDGSPEAVTAMVADVRARLEAFVPELAYWDVLEVWGPDALLEDFNNFVVLFYVVAGIAMLAALVLIFTTMNTVVREQTREIGMMKALGGTRRRISLAYLQTATLLGIAGTALGVVLGIPLSNRLTSFMSEEFGGTAIGWRVSGLAVVLSCLVGLGGTALASWPAVHRAARVTVREALTDHGVTAGYGLGSFDRAASRVGFMSRPHQMGVRNVTRRMGRSFATAVPIGLAVGTMLAFAAVSITALDETANSQGLEGGDIIVWNNGSRGLDATAEQFIEAVPDVDFAHQMLYSNVQMRGERWVWGLPATSTYRPDILAGRWFTEQEASAAAPVVVVGEALANETGIAVGETVTLESRRGPVDLAVIGIDGQLVNDGQGMFSPLRTVFEYEGVSTGNTWVRTVSPEPEVVDRAAAAIHRVMEQHGYDVGTSLRYVQRNQNEAENRLVVTTIMAMGLPIVAIGMIGLVNAMTTNILDRTREIGILRSIGATRRHLRAMFRAEGLAIAFMGWVLGLPVGYLLGRFIMWVLENEFHAGFTFLFPLWPLLAALGITILVTLLVVRLPIRRVLSLQPGRALRYE